MEQQMRWIVIYLAASAGIGCAAQARAQDFPPRKPGLWQIDMMVSAARGPQQMKMCIDAGTDAEMYKMGINAAQGMCGKPAINRSGSTVTVDSACKMGETQTTTHAVTKFTGDTAYHTEADSRLDPPLAGRDQSKVVQDGKWVGPCPADMAPGDMTMANGMKMNMKQMFGAKP
jgi:hypothetical protein